MPPPSTIYKSRAGNSAYDPATLSDDDEEDDSASTGTTSTFAAETTVLGYSDGVVPQRSRAELHDWRLSRIGGDPVRRGAFSLSASLQLGADSRAPFSQVFPPLPSLPPSSSSACGSCGESMPLLTQIYCPLEASALERVVYVFGCPRRACRGKEGAVRGWRASTLWLEEQEEEEVIEEEKVQEKEGTGQQAGAGIGSLIFGGPTRTESTMTTTKAASASANSNPFSTTTTTTTTNPFASSSANPFALSSNPFAPPSASASAATNPFAPLPKHIPAAPSPPNNNNIPAPAPPSSASARAAPAPPAPSSSSSLSWPPHPNTYTPHWLTTAYEPSSSSSSAASKAAAKQLAALSLSSSSSPLDDSTSHHHWKEGKASGGRTKKIGAGAGGGTEAGWGKESYEVQRVKGVDEVFLRFQERVGREPLQVVRFVSSLSLLAHTSSPAPVLDADAHAVCFGENRYQHSSQPLPYSSHSAPYRLLFPNQTGDGAAEEQLGTWTPSRIPPCQSCGLPSVFEYQLMPGLVALLNRTGTAVKKGKGAGGEGSKKSVMQEDGLDFASVWGFACVGECCDSGEGAGGWREERVLVEWEDE